MSTHTNNRDSTLRAGIYLRISDDKEGEGLGVARQGLDCEALCERNGWSVIDVYSDNDRSAFSGKSCEHYSRLLDAVKNALIDVIVCWHPDRLHRSPRELEDFIDLLELSGVTVATVTAGERDFASADGRFMARMEGSVARRESEHKSQRIRSKHKQLAEGGRPVSGRRPFGYEWIAKGDKPHGSLRVIAAERKLVREAVKRVLSGESLYAISKDWNERGIATVTGKSEWSPKTLKQILIAGRIAGFRDYHGEHIASDQWKPLVKVDDWNAVRAILLDPARVHHRVARSYLLGQGLLRCDECGAKLVAAPRRNRAGDFIPRYGCVKAKGGCGRLSIMADPVEAIVSDAAVRALSDPAFVARLGGGTGGDDTESYQTELKELEDSLKEAARDFYVDKITTRPEFLAARNGLVPKLDAAKKALAAATRQRPSALLSDLDNLEAKWPTLGLDRQRALIELCMESVSITMPKRPREPLEAFDPTRVQKPLWRA